MGSIARQKASGDFKILDEGTHLAICSAVVDIGLQETPWGDKEQVWLRFEVPAERNTFLRDGEEIDEPMFLWQRYNKTLSKKAALRQDLESWRGRDFTKEELDGFDLFNLIGKPCLITVVHNHVEDRTYANITAVTRIMKGQEVPPFELNALRFSPEDTGAFEILPPWLQSRFEDRKVPPQPAPAPALPEDPDDDIAF